MLRGGANALDQPTDTFEALKASHVKLMAVRHGQSEANAAASRAGVPILCGQAESPLSALGRQQAQDAARKIYDELGGDAWLQKAALNPQMVPVLYSSPLSRAHDTALATSNFIADRARALVPQAAELLQEEVQPKLDSRLLEINYGSEELRPVPDVVRDNPVLMHKWDSYGGIGVDFTDRFPAGESRADVLQRVDSFLHDVASHDQGRTVLAFCHLETIVGMETDLGLMPLQDGHLHVQASGIRNAAHNEVKNGLFQNAIGELYGGIPTKVQRARLDDVVIRDGSLPL